MGSKFLKIIAIMSVQLVSTFAIYGQFTGQYGVYYLGTTDVPVATSLYSNPSISGIVCRFNWSSVKTSSGVFNWSFIDGEILKDQNANKKICLQPLGRSQWLATTLDAQQFYSIDNNTYHSTYGQVVSDILPFDTIYIGRIRNLIKQMAIKYINKSTVSYVNVIGGHISSGMPDTVLTDTKPLTKEAFWKVYKYNAYSVAAKMYPLFDYYMSVFPNTPLWCSVDFVLFELQASSRVRNYFASLYTNYGITNYSSRFGLWC